VRSVVEQERQRRIETTTHQRTRENEAMSDLEFESVDGRTLDLARVLDLYGAVG